MTDTGNMIRLCRTHLKWPRAYLAEKSGVPLNTIINVEGKSDCKVSTFEKLLEAMGYEIEIMRKEE